MEGKAGLVIDLPAEDEKEELVARIDSSSDSLAVGTVLDLASTTVTEPEIGPQKPPAMGVRRKSCTYTCYCICHEDDGDASAVILKRKSKVFGKVSKSKGPCSEQTCQGAVIVPEHKKKLVLPSSLFRQGLASLMMNRGWTVKHHLNTYRMVPETSVSMRYARHGDLHNLKACIEDGSATPYDTAVDGWSLLHVSYFTYFPYLVSNKVLQTAAYHGQLTVVQYLLKLGADTEVGEVGARYS